MALGFGCQGPVPAMYSCTVQAWPASQEISSSREESLIQLVVAHGGGRTVTWGPVTPEAGARRRPSAHSIDGAHHGPWTRGGTWSMEEASPSSTFSVRSVTYERGQLEAAPGRRPGVHSTTSPRMDEPTGPGVSIACRHTVRIMQTDDGPAMAVAGAGTGSWGRKSEMCCPRQTGCKGAQNLGAAGRAAGRVLMVHPRRVSATRHAVTTVPSECSLYWTGHGPPRRL